MKIIQVASRVSLEALQGFDQHLTMEEQHAICGLVSEILEPVLVDGVWQKIAWLDPYNHIGATPDARSVAFRAYGECEKSWTKAFMQDFRLTLQSTPGYFTKHKLMNHALVVARCQLALAIHLLNETHQSGAGALLAFQEGEHYGLKLHRPPSAPKLCPLAPTEGSAG